MTNDKYHEPVLVKEVVEALGKGAHLKGKVFIDATVGTGGHSLKIIKGGGFVLGIDLDPLMIEIAESRLEDACPASRKKTGGCFSLVQGNFRKIDEISRKNGMDEVDGILFDLGVSNLHLTASDRGFSFSDADAPLDMRLDSSGQGVKASDLLNGLREDHLKEMFSLTLPYSAAKKLAKRVAEVRLVRPFERVGDFLKVLGGVRKKPGLNPATLPFLALRIAVNTELDNLKEALEASLGVLKKEGRLAVITFHSGEDSIVKSFFASKNMKEGNVLTKKAIYPSLEEVEENPRSRSAQLRVFEKS